ncbi:SLC13 family permease [Luteolibacter ambystomatis]|uniref:SLC13 family permease n=1 Tax=Luteolibacter ambystomatis TaxID=2824561 RepID=A0A975J0J2_9BACT|nr:SLC13 family permease [Luteolibacter ambystomatis]QUE51786.1 SLC13 family permease [Luteolibacter ambystomatis]
MTLEIALTLTVIAVTLVAFIREWAAPDVIALTVLCAVVALGLVDANKMTDVFRNEAPLTIAALFIIGGALEKSGAVDHIGRVLRDKLPNNTRMAMLAFSLLTAFFSAWMNNTAIVAILLPVALGLARSKDIPASRLLMPLSYSSILGGCCTLIGTSTNLLVNGTLKDLHMEPMSMFQLAPVGIPLTIAGIGYLAIFGPKLIPARTSISGTLEITQRTTPLYHLLVSDQSPLIGQKLTETALFDRANGIHIMEVRRKGARVMKSLKTLTVEKNDRFLIALHRRRGRAAKPDALFAEIGAQVLSTVDGIVTELVVRDESSLIGETLAASDFRQRYNCVVLALHRNGVNITSQIANEALESGDTLLVITALNNLDDLEATRDFILTDSPDDAPEDDATPRQPAHHIWLSWGTLVGVVLVATLTDFLGGKDGVWPWLPQIPIHYAALVGALALLWMKVVTPRDAYTSIDWQVLLMLYGLLGLGMAMQNTGTARWLADSLVGLARGHISHEMLPGVMLWAIFLMTLLLTEVLSNNATAVMMVPIVVKLAASLGVSHWPFVMAVTVAASTAFALPMGYQTHMMVYGPGGYKFSDFLRVGIPLNIICWITACTLIPFIWPFYPAG